MCIFVFLITVFSWIKSLSSAPPLIKHPPHPPKAMMSNRCPSWTSTLCPFFLSSLKSRDSMKTCSYCHFTNNFFNFNYSRISTGEYFLSHSITCLLPLCAYKFSSYCCAFLGCAPLIKHRSSNKYTCFNQNVTKAPGCLLVEIWYVVVTFELHDTVKTIFRSFIYLHWHWQLVPWGLYLKHSCFFIE